jgi:nucleotide-binding universal stress UspA family protein
MFKNILVPVDGSATAQLAVEKAIGLAKAFDSRVTAIFVIDPYPFTGVGTDFAYGQAEYLSAATAEANAAIKVAKTAFELPGAVWSRRLRPCRPT